jgi:hypothetical protein
MVTTGKAAARKLTHARILLLADAASEGPGRTDEQIAESLGVGGRTVSRVRERFVEEGFEVAVIRGHVLDGRANWKVRWRKTW